VVETHISTLLFVGDRVFKVRKPVQFPFVDFRRADARRADCQREVELNRRLAPDVYLGVADLTLNGESLDSMVVMRRLPEERRLATLVRTGADTRSALHEVARTLAEFHRTARRSPDISAAASAEAIRAGWKSNFAENAPFVGPVLDPAVDTEVLALVDRWLAGRAPLLRERAASGRICDGHGDLLAEDIFCLDDGPRILDCVEFDDHLRFGDVCADVCFLAMDLERLGDPAAAVRFLEDYQSLAGDRFPVTLVHFSVAERAYVRVKVACLRGEQGQESAFREARQLHELALRHLREGRVRLVLVGGLPGSGKTTLARGIGAARDWKILRSDEVRAELIPREGPRRGYGEGRYAAEATGAVYAEMLRRARVFLGSGESVVLDASWVSQAQRAQAVALAEHTSSDLTQLQCQTDPAEATARIVNRMSRGLDESEATPEVRAEMRRAMDPWPASVLVATCGAPPEATLARALTALG